MKLRDILTLISSKLKIRKLRTLITIITASVLFGVVITVLFVAKGFFNNLDKLTKTAYGDDIISSVSYQNNKSRTPEVQAKAIELYNKSTDPNKQFPVITYEPDPVDGYVVPPSLDTSNIFAIQAAALLQHEQNQATKSSVAEIAEPYGGKVIAALNQYCSGSLNIEALTPEQYIDSVGCYNDAPGRQVLVVDNDILTHFIKISQQKDDVIQILIPLDQAARLIGISRPRYTEPNPASKLQDYVNTVNQQAIGRQFTGSSIAANANQPTEITYEIVGILPPREAISTIDPFSINPLESIINSIYYSNNMQIIVTNPDSTAFKSSYTIEINEYSNDVLVSFNNIDQFKEFQTNARHQTPGYTISIAEFIGTRLGISHTSDSIYRIIIAFTIVFAIVSIIIMAGTISRVIDDERSSIALYRTVGATTKNILQIYTGYIFTISLLIIICSTAISLILSTIITITNSALITANISAMLNLANLAPGIFIGFDPLIFLIYLAIIIVGATCLLLTLDKIISKNIIKNLRK